MARLGVSYIDVYQLHDVEFAENLDIVINGALRACEDLKKQGKIGAIGLNGYPLSVLKEGIIKAKGRIDTVLTYARYSLVDDSLLDYLPFFKENNLGIINASPHGCG
jgi:aryl-alcohol dehydrogenase-like predicted oxidoreductase